MFYQFRHTINKVFGNYPGAPRAEWPAAAGLGPGLVGPRARGAQPARRQQPLSSHHERAGPNRRRPVKLVHDHAAG